MKAPLNLGDIQRFESGGERLSGKRKVRWLDKGEDANHAQPKSAAASVRAKDSQVVGRQVQGRRIRIGSQGTADSGRVYAHASCLDRDLRGMGDEHGFPRKPSRGVNDES